MKFGMKRFPSTAWLLSAVVLLCGCGGGVRTSLPPSSPPSPPLAQGLNAAGNWQFNTTSTAGTPPATIAGSLTQSNSSISGAVHIDGSNCFDQLTTIMLTGTRTDNNHISLTSASVDGQVATFTGGIADNAFTGTYSIDGGCANGDRGTFSGSKIHAITDDWSGSFTSLSGGITNSTAKITQGTASSEGSFGVTGTVTFADSLCFSSGTIMSGTFPSASYMLGTLVALRIVTANGTVAFVGTARDVPSGTEISGDYTIVGGSCGGETGTAILGASPWDY